MTSRKGKRLQSEESYKTYTISDQEYDSTDFRVPLFFSDKSLPNATGINVIQNITDLSKYLPASTIQKCTFVINLDDTILRPAQLLGTEAWFKRHYSRLKRKRFPDKKAMEETKFHYDRVQHHTCVKLCEPSTRDELFKLKNSGVNLIIATNRGGNLAATTRRQLMDLDLEFLVQDTPISDQSFYFEDDPCSIRTSKVDGGIVYCNGRNKGKLIWECFTRIGYNPENVVVVDDRERHCKSIIEESASKGITCIAFHYNRFSGDRSADFNSKIADVQLSEVKRGQRIPTDDEAREAIKAGSLRAFSRQVQYSQYAKGLDCTQTQSKKRTPRNIL